MSEAHKAAVREYIAAAAIQDWDGADEAHGEGWRQHNPDGTIADSSNFREQVSVFFAGFPDLAPTIHDQIAEGDKVVTHLTWSGTHTGEFMGMPPTGKHCDFEVIRIDRFSGGQMAETRVMFNAAAVMQQLGG